MKIGGIMKLNIALALAISIPTAAVAEQDSKSDFLRDGISIAQRSCDNQTKFDYLTANAALAGEMGGGIRKQAVLVAEKIVSMIGADKSGAATITDKRIDFFKKNIPMAKYIVLPGVSGQRYQDCFDQSVRELNEAVNPTQPMTR